MLQNKPRFSSPPDPMLFKHQVWELVRWIPKGKVTTYGRIAAMLPTPGGMNPKDYLAFGARWVGGAMAACPEDVPWQRVINAQGKISLRAEGSSRQRELLEEEGIVFEENGRINLSRYLWNGEMDPSDQGGSYV
jgi:methylated-DNA-protein-cysteine methyltransferase related protein